MAKSDRLKNGVFVETACTCYRIRPFAHTKGPFHRELRELSLKSGPVNIPTLELHDSLHQDTLTRFQNLALLQGPTTRLSALQLLLMLLRHADTQLLNVLHYPVEAGVHTG